MMNGFLFFGILILKITRIMKCFIKHWNNMTPLNPVVKRKLADVVISANFVLRLQRYCWFEEKN